MFPWSIWGLQFLRKLKHWRELRKQTDPAALFAVYCLCWAVCPLIFFAPARSVLFSYAVPSMPAFAMLFGALAEKSAQMTPQGRARWFWGLGVAAALSAIFLALLGCSSWTEFALGLAAFAVLALITRRYLRSHSIVQQSPILLTSVIIVTWGQAILVAITPRLDGYLSTRSLMRHMEDYSSHAQLTFAGKLPYSASFYALDTESFDIAVNKTGGRLSRLPEDNAVALTKREKKEVNNHLPGMGKSVKIGRWFLFQPKEAATPPSPPAK
jgi:4-amino-4-deoxy-L-arabinose transferase-like glycosyltransferase